MIIDCIIFPDNYTIQLSDIFNFIIAIATLGLAIFAIFQINGIKNGNRNVIKTNLTNYETEIVKLNFEVRNITNTINDDILSKDINSLLRLFNRQEKYLDDLFLMTDSLCFYLLSLSKNDEIKNLYYNRIIKICKEYTSEVKLDSYLNIKKYLNEYSKK